MTREHRVSRRVLLGAACVLPLGRHPGLDPGSSFFSSLPQAEGSWTPDPPDPIRGRGDEEGEAAQSFLVPKWDRALAAYRRAEAAVAAMQGAPDALFDPCNLRFNRALSRLLRTPAPHLAALAAKLDLLVAHEAWELGFAAPALSAIRRDARRLASLRSS